MTIAPIRIRISLKSIKQTENGASQTELDSHAECCVLGKNSLIFQDFGRTVSVTGYDPEGPVNSAEVVSGAIAYDDPSDGNTIILIIHQAIKIETLDNNLLCPMQLRLNDVIVNDTPKFLCGNVDNQSHALIMSKDGNEHEKFILTLELFGVISGFHHT